MYEIEAKANVRLTFGCSAQRDLLCMGLSCIHTAGKRIVLFVPTANPSGTGNVNKLYETRKTDCRTTVTERLKANTNLSPVTSCLRTRVQG